jgi:hypothetical protein
MFKHLWYRISYLGVPAEKRHELREIILCNRIILISLILVFFFIPVEIVLNGYKLVPIELLCGGLFAFPLLFNHLRYHTFSKYYTVVFSTLLVALMTLVVGGGSNSEYVLLPLLIAPMLLFNGRAHIFILAAFVATVFFLLKEYAGQVDPFVYVDDKVKKQVQPMMMFMSMFSSLNVSYLKMLQDTKKEVEVKQKEVMDSIHYARRIQMAQIPSDKRVQSMLKKAASG